MADNNTSQLFRTEHTSDGSDLSDDDNDSTMGESIASSTISLSPSVVEYQHQHGRRYHAFRAGQYYMPNDEQEQDLMDLVHCISLMVRSLLSKRSARSLHLGSWDLWKTLTLTI